MSLMDENSGQNDASINNMIPSKLFPGYIGELLFHYALGVKVPKQLDLLDFFYPGLIIMEEPAKTIMKDEAFFDDKDLMIHAEKHNDSFYAGGSNVLPCNETGLVRAQEHYHVCDIHRVPDSSGRLLQGIRSIINMICVIDPAGGD